MSNYGFVGPVGNATSFNQTANGIVESWEQTNASKTLDWPLNDYAYYVTVIIEKNDI